MEFPIFETKRRVLVVILSFIAWMILGYFIPKIYETNFSWMLKWATFFAGIIVFFNQIMIRHKGKKF